MRQERERSLHNAIHLTLVVLRLTQRTSLQPPALTFRDKLPPVEPLIELWSWATFSQLCHVLRHCWHAGVEAPNTTQLVLHQHSAEDSWEPDRPSRGRDKNLGLSTSRSSDTTLFLIAVHRVCRITVYLIKLYLWINYHFIQHVLTETELYWKVFKVSFVSFCSEEISSTL